MRLILSAIRRIHVSSAGVASFIIRTWSSLITGLDEGTPIRQPIVEAGALGQAARDHVAHDRLDLDDVEPPAEHLTVGERPEVVRRHPRALEALEHRRRHPVVDDALADDRAPLERVEGRGVVLEILDDQAWVVRGVHNLGLALVELRARLDVHRCPPRVHWMSPTRRKMASTFRRYHAGSKQAFSSSLPIRSVTVGPAASTSKNGRRSRQARMAWRWTTS